MPKTPVKKSVAKSAGPKKRARGAVADMQNEPVKAETASKAGRAAGKAAKAAKGTDLAAIRVPAPVEGAVDACVLDRLFAVVSSRRGTDPAISHSARLLSRGTRKIAQKFGEEAVECLIEAVAGRPDELVGESADVLYHLIVLWVDAGIEPAQVWAELQRREGTSGIAEKASRSRKVP